MQIQIESTNILTFFGGVPVRLWNGVTADGTPCKVFIHRLAVGNDQDSTAFDRELSEQFPPSENRHVPLSRILSPTEEKL